MTDTAVRYEDVRAISDEPTAVAGSRRWAVLIAVLLLAGALALAVVRLNAPEAGLATESGGPGAASAAAQTGEGSAVATVPIDAAPEGMEAVIDSEGRVRGYVASNIDAAQFAPLSSREGGVEAYEVVNQTDDLVGYMVPGLGFVELGTAQDAAQMDALLAEHDQLREKYGIEDPVG